ncbi:restriction endonuclease subunit S [Fusobacterium sp.]|uniref:restriction endonuclease subunit S n=1 Tax=Fusobacterium sp. TaxID=68766 RepID=UPI00261B90B1|nr:restriction endonuclease subunit S [Fusobacterium sp.]
MPKKKGELSIEERLEQSIVAKEEEPYKLPSNWVWTRLGDITEKNQYGYTAKAENNGEIKYLRITDIQDNKVIWKNVPYCNIDKKDLEKFKLKENDIVVTRTGATTGKSFLIETINCDAVFASYLIRVRAVKGLPKYLWSYMKTNLYWHQITEFSSGIAQSGVNAQKLENLLFPLPPLEEQKRIVEKLDSLFEKIQKIKEIIEEVKEKTTSRREAILSKAFSGELTEKWRGENHTENARELLVKINDEKIRVWEDECKKAEDEGRKKPAKPKLKTIDEMLVEAEEEPYKLPNNWVWIKLGELGEYKKGPFGSSLTKSMFVPKGENTIKVYEQKNAIQKDWKLGNYYITEEYFKNNMTSFEVKEKDIIVSCAGTIGETYILPIGIEKGIINQALMRITLSKNISEKYYLFYFDYILKKASNDLSNGSAIKNIPPFKIFKELGFALPPLEEQKEIVRVLDKVFEEENRISELISLENKIEILEKTILDRAFRGELGTGNNDDEPAIELLKKCLEER